MSEQNKGNGVDIVKILELLPHRYPFVLIDRVLGYEAGATITALKNVTINEPFFQGHFPGKPVMPGVMILEGMAQAGAVLAFLSNPDMTGNKLFYFAGIDGARFRKVILPGDTIIFKLEFIKQKARIIKMAARAYVDDNLACEAELIASFS